MSWRETLGAIDLTRQPFTQNPQNPHNSPLDGVSADFADSANWQPNTEESRLLEALAEACRGFSIAPGEVLKAMALEDIEDWRDGEISEETYPLSRAHWYNDVRWIMANAQHTTPNVLRASVAARSGCGLKPMSSVVLGAGIVRRENRFQDRSKAQATE